MRHKLADFRFAALPAALALAFSQAGWADPINAGGNPSNLPTNGVGNAAVTGSSLGTNSLTVNINGRAVIDWATFNVGSGYTLNFNGAAGNAVLNRVPQGNAPSTSTPNVSNINGNVNGAGITVMLMNPNGIVFGPGAQVNVARLVATTGLVDENQFITHGNAVISYPSGYPGAAIVNQGYLTAETAGLVALVAPSVTNQGVISATSGRIILAGEESVTISLNGLYEMTVDKTAVGSIVTNSGTLTAGNILLSAQDASSIASGIINLEGIQQASRIEVNGNHVALKSDLDATTVAGASRTVDVCHCGQIQDGIDIAATGATVDVAAGTYAQTKTLKVNKSITLDGAGEADTIIDTRSVTSVGGGYGMLVNADNVVLSDFTLYGPTVDASSAYGIKVQPAGSAATSRLNNFSIARVTTRGAGRAELDLNGVNGATIDHVTANGAPVGNDAGTTKGAGIQVTDSSNVTIRNSITRNNAWGGVALYQANRAFDQQTTNIVVETNNHFNEANPLYLQDESATKNFGSLTLEGFDFMVRNSDTASGNNQYTWLQYTLGGAVDLAVNVTAPGSSTIQGWNVSAPDHSFYVGVGNKTGGGTQAMSIMKAVDTAVVGDTINIAPGSYTERASNRTIPGTGGTYDLGLFINTDNLTLRGIDASGNPITNADQVQAWITAETSTNFGMNHGVSSDNVTIEGLGFKPHVAGANKTIEIAGDNFTFRNSVVDNRSVSGGAGALYFGELDPAGHQISRLTVTGSKFLDGSVVLTEGVGLAADGVTYQPAADRVISNNTFTGSANYRFGGLLMNGRMAEIPWRVHAIGAATIAGNHFSGFNESVLVRGEQQGIDLRQVMSNNTFDRSVLVTDGAGNARGETYQSTPDGVHFTPRLKYSIQSGIQAGVDRSQSGDTISVGAGTYAESVTVNGSRNLVFNGATLQSLTVNDTSGLGGSATANGAGFAFNAPIVLLSDLSLATTGGDIVFNGDVQNAGTAPFALGLSTGAGNISMLSGGSEMNPIGFFSVAANDFTLNGTLWVTGFNVGASGNIALSAHSLHATASGGVNVLSAGGSVTGATFSESVLLVNAGGDVQLIIDAPTGSVVAAVGQVAVLNVGVGVIEVNGERQPNNRVTSLGTTRIIPPDNALPRESRVPAAPPTGGGTEIPVTAETAGDALERGLPVEIDLTPGPRRRR